MEYLNILGKAVREITPKFSFEECTGNIQVKNTKTRYCKEQYFKQVKNFKDL